MSAKTARSKHCSKRFAPRRSRAERDRRDRPRHRLQRRESTVGRRLPAYSACWRGIAGRSEDDEARLERGFPVFDDLHAFVFDTAGGENEMALSVPSCFIAGALGAQPTPSQKQTSTRPARVVFVCEHGTVKSLAAVEYFNRPRRSREG